MVDRISY